MDVAPGICTSRGKGLCEMGFLSLMSFFIQVTSDAKVLTLVRIGMCQNSLFSSRSTYGERWVKMHKVSDRQLSSPKHGRVKIVPLTKGARL